MKKTTLAAALALAAGASAAHAQTTLDTAGGTLLATTLEGTAAFVAVRTADGAQVRLEVLPSGAGAPDP